jgi:hypothetical protein
LALLTVFFTQPENFGKRLNLKTLRGKGMMKLNKKAFLTVALLGATLGLTNCSSTPTNTATITTTNTGNTAVVNGKATNVANDVVKTDAPAGDKIGVPECDDYIAKYEACVNGKVPEAQRAVFKSSFDTMRKTWKDAAATPQGKAGLATGCKQALESAKQSMNAFSCNW